MRDRTAADEETVRQLEHESHEAFLRSDAEALAPMLAEDFVFIDPEGRLVGKAEWIAEMTKGDVTYESFEIEDLRVRVYGDAAVTNGRVSVRTRSGRGTSTDRYCYTAMYVRQGGRWQVVAEQANVLTGE
jgi:uncharacterized protein (TIGR02246 family)